jgi:hypothetical protein
MREEAMTECSYTNYSAVSSNQRPAALMSVARDSPCIYQIFTQQNEGQFVSGLLISEQLNSINSI